MKKVFKKSWADLTPKQKMLRERSLEVLAKSRKSPQSLSRIAKDFGMSVSVVINNTNAFKKVNKRWVAKRFDKISRSMIINEEGKKISVEISDSRHASTIGKYHNAVKELKNGNKKKILEFSKKKIRDSNGKLHSFETRAKKIISIEEKVEEPEFTDVYEFE